MRSLSSSLLAAQKQVNVKPKVNLVIRDQQILVNRLDWTLLYAGSESEGYVGGAQASDSFIIRARIESTSLKVQRVTDVENSSQWSSWTTLVETGGVANDCNPLVVADPQGAEVWLFYVDNTGYTIKYFKSTDYGASWGSASTVKTESAGDSITGLGGDIRSTGGDHDPMLFYCHNPAGEGADSVLKYVEYSGGWGTPSTWSVSGKYTLKGVACTHQGDWNLLVAGRESDAPYNWRLWAIVLGDGYSYGVGTWGGLEEILVSDNLALSFQYPSLVYADLFRALYQESFSDAGGYDRLVHFRNVSGADYVDNQFTDGAPLDLTTSYNGVLAHTTGSYLYLLTAKKAYRANIGTAASVDVSDYVLAYRSLQTETGAPVTTELGRFPMVIELDNSEGIFAHIGEVGDAYEAIKRGSQIELRRGYLVGGTSYTHLHPYCWIEDYEFQELPGGGKLVLYCVSGWELLERWRADRQYFWADGEANVFTIASRILGFLGFEFSLKTEASAEISSFKPSFTINPGETGRNALLRLLEKVPDKIFFYDDTAYARELSSSESPCYSYGASGEHPILEGHHRLGSAHYNHVQIFGKDGAFGEALNFPEIELMGHRLQKILDYAYETSGECLFRAEAELRDEEVRIQGDVLVIRPNVGQELYDPVTITYSGSGLDPINRRVMAIIEEYEARKGVYQQKLMLGDV